MLCCFAKNQRLRAKREPALGFCYTAPFLKSNAMVSEGFVFQYLSENLAGRYAARSFYASLSRSVQWSQR
jgi:hypothetical protein